MDTLIQPAAAARRTRRRHSAEFKAQIAAACRQLGVSIAAVALANGLNANLVRRWLVEHESGPRTLSAPPAPSLHEPSPTFVPLEFARGARRRRRHPDRISRLRGECHGQLAAVGRRCLRGVAEDRAAMIRVEAVWLAERKSQPAEGAGA